VADRKHTSDELKLNLRDDFPPHAYEAWRKEAERSLKGAAFEKALITQTYEGIALQPIYRQEDLEKFPLPESFPGFAPYLRGSRAAPPAGEAPWLIAQEIPCSIPGEFNEALRQDLQRGQTAVYLMLDQPTRAGLDSDRGQSGEAGRGGIPLSTLEDLETALNGIDLEKIPLYINAGSSGLFAASFLAARLKKQGKDLSAVSGAIEADPLGELLRTGSLPVALEQLYDEMAALTFWAIRRAPGLQTAAVRGDLFHNAGGNAVQELAFAVAAGTEYLREMLSRRLAIDDIAPRIRFTFALGSHFFMEIAKLRAARMVWSQIVREFGGGEEAQKMRIHARTSVWNKTLYDPYVNMLRATTEAFSGIAGGCDSLHVGAFDEPAGLPSEFSRRIARNTQIILKEESHLDRVIDPAGGSWYVETLTRQVAEKVWKLFQEVEAQGGMFRALEKGFPREQIVETAQKRAENIARRKDKIIGTNIYPNLKEEPAERRQTDFPAIFRERARHLKNFRESRASGQHPFDKLPTSLHFLEKPSPMGSAPPDQLMEALGDAALAGATLGELSQALRSGKGGAPSITPLKLHRGAEIFEYLRRAMEAHREKTGAVPKVFLANMGAVSQYKARADFSAGFFQVAGFEVLDAGGFSNPEEAARAALASGAAIVVICSTDENYPAVVEPLTRRIKQANPQMPVVLAGYPQDQVEAHRKAGVDEFIHLRANAAELLGKFMQRLGVQI